MEVLQDYGIQCFINDEKLPKNILDYFGGYADMAVDAVGKEAVFQRTFHVVKKLGRIVVGAIDESSTGYSVNMTKVFWQPD